MEYIAHSTAEKFQSVKEHSENTAKLAQDFSIQPLKQLIYNTAILHDIGKYQPTFQRRIRGSNDKITHALCGAKEAEVIFPNNILTKIMQYCIAGHHCGLHDAGTIADTDTCVQSSLFGTLQKETEDYSFYKNEIKTKTIDEKQLERYLKQDCNDRQSLTEKIDFLIRYCFSCLTDADSLDTEEFCNGQKRMVLSSNYSEALDSLNLLFGRFKPQTELQKARSLLQQQVYQNVENNSKIFLINMPTGSGKTLCSLKFSLERAVRHNKKRIIYIIPYNSIIDQTAEIFQQKISSLNVLRHQSSFLYEEEQDLSEDYKHWALKATENWDVDFIITTAVQFFESIYGNKRSKLRKLHNMSDSILIFDEAHLMPVKYLEPCMKSIAYITTILNSEALFLTATMPNFKNLLQDKFNINIAMNDVIKDKTLYKVFKKCSYSYAKYKDVDELLSEHNEASRLVIVNSKKTAQNIFNSCSGEVYHLSTYMTGVDRVNTINTIKDRIKLLEKDFENLIDIPPDRKITVVSTSLIEAGVDLDFNQVYRELAGIDNILQAGGRCNREGKRDSGKVVVFETEEFCRKLNDEQSVAKHMLEKYSDIDDPRCIDEYYERLFKIKSDEISSCSIYEEGQKPYILNFKTYAEKFRFIDDKNISIVVPIDEYIQNIMDSAKQLHFVNARKVQKYVVTVSFWEFESLKKQHVIDDFETGVYFLTNLDYYDSDTGIQFEGKDYFL